MSEFSRGKNKSMRAMKVLAEVVLATVLLVLLLGTCAWLLGPPRVSSTPTPDPWDGPHGARGSWRLWQFIFGPNLRKPHGHTLTAWPLTWSTEAQCARFRVEKLRQPNVHRWDPSTHITWICAPLTPDT